MDQDTQWHLPLCLILMPVVVALSTACLSLRPWSALVRTKKALVIGSERITWFLNWSMRDTAVLFGDGAGAVVVETSEEESGLLRWGQRTHR